MRPVESSQWIELPVPAIVSEELFDAVADQLRENAMRSRVQKSKARYLLQGLAVCRCCGYAMTGRRIHGGDKSKYEYYRCGGPAHSASGSSPGDPPAPRRCWNKPVRVDRLEEAVWSDVRALLNQPGRIQEEFQRRLQCDQQPRPAQKRAAEARARQVERSIQRLIDGYEEGLLEKMEFAPRVKAAREQLAKLKQEVKTQATLETQKAQMRWVTDNVNDFAEKVSSGLAQANWETRREIIRALVKEIEIDQD
jgi:site-specific DNA recombinase